MRRTSVAVVALATAFAVTTFLRAEEQARSRWGRARPAVVAQRDLEPGETVDSSAVEVRDLPVTVVADAALSVPPVGSVVRYPVVAGEPLVGDRLAPEGVTGLAALVPEGHRAVGLPQGQLGMPPLQIGDVVDVLVVSPPAGGVGGHSHSYEAELGPAPSDDLPSSDASESAFPLATGSRVVDVSEQVVTITVPSDEAPSLAYAAASGVVMLTLTGT